ncbi:MAG: hypothetical protein JWO67_3822 [Streptosporangiaceae bacterium]|nr:hypothetical protein [Streptosporangiaceae bacterium]
MMGHRTPNMTGAEWDTLAGRRFYCYLQRAGVTAGIKRQMRRRERRLGKLESRVR